jgi:hypothetical protein
MCGLNVVVQWILPYAHCTIYSAHSRTDHCQLLDKSIIYK